MRTSCDSNENTRSNAISLYESDFTRTSDNLGGHVIPSIIVGNMAVVQQSGMNGEKPNFTIGSKSEDGFVSGNLQEEVRFLSLL